MHYETRFTIAPDIEGQQKDFYVKKSIRDSARRMGDMILQINGMRQEKTLAGLDMLGIRIEAFRYSDWLNFKRSVLTGVTFDPEMRQRLKRCFERLQESQTQESLEKEGYVFPEKVEF